MSVILYFLFLRSIDNLIFQIMANYYFLVCHFKGTDNTRTIVLPRHIMDTVGFKAASYYVLGHMAGILSVDVYYCYRDDSDPDFVQTYVVPDIDLR